jgi:hypothetical protein
MRRRWWQLGVRMICAATLLGTAVRAPAADAAVAFCLRQAPGSSEFAVQDFPTTLATGDFDNDGKADFVVANTGDLSDPMSVSIRLGNGLGNFVPPSAPRPAQISTTGKTTSVATGDFNRDGNLDFVATNNAANTISVRLGDGQGGFTLPAAPRPAEVTVGTNPRVVAVGDFNGDATPDLIAGNDVGDNFSIRLGDRQGGFGPPLAPHPADFSVTATVPKSFAVADINNDGRPDVAVGGLGGATIPILLGDGQGGFIAPPAPRPATVVLPVGVDFSVAFGDVNNDGKLDLLALTQSAELVFVRLGDGQGGFSPPSAPTASQVTVGDAPESIAVGDIDGDGNLDFVTANTGDRTVSFRLGDGTGGFTANSASEVDTSQNGGVDSRPTFVVLADLTSDNVPDLLVANGGVDSVAIRVNCRPDSPPTVAVPGARTVAEDGTLTFSNGVGAAITVADPDALNLPVRLTLSAAHGTLSLAGTGGLTFTTGDGTDDPTMTFAGTLPQLNAAIDGLTYRPAPNYNGPDQLSTLADDQGNLGIGGPLQGAGAVPITVTPVNDPPTAANDAFSVLAGTTLTIADPGLLANDADIDSGSLTAAKVANPAHGSVTVNPHGGFSYTPTTDFVGPDSFTYRVNDGSADSGVATVTIAVTSSTPAAVNDAFSVATGATLTVAAPGVLGNDVGVNPGLTAVKVADPAHGTLTLSSNGGFSYVPSASFSGTDSFTYRATDSTGTSVAATVAIAVTPTRCGPRPPVRTTPVAGGGKLSVHIEGSPQPTLQNNPLKKLTFGTLQNARVVLNGQAITSGQVVTLPANAFAVDFTIERVAPGQATTVPLTVEDGCGEWQTFVGGGTSAGF